jgi:hypothetical protein
MYMPRISMWQNGAHTNDFNFFDKRIHEMFTVGGTGINVHKYVGIIDQGASNDASQPRTTENDPLAIQDFLFLENRDRKYDQDVYNLRGIYNVADTDFDLSQFGLFLSNDTVFITFHLNDMVEALGRKLMPGDVLELPHLKDYHSLDTSLDLALSRYYVVQEGTRPSEGYSPTWWPHLWRVKCTPLVDSQEYKDILDKIQVDPSTGEETTSTLRDLLSTYQKELEITDKVVEQAEKEVPESGYDVSKYYVVPTDTNGNPLDPSGHRTDETDVSTDNTNLNSDSSRITPRNANAYSGYLVGDGLAPNGHPITMGTSFPSDAIDGDFTLRLDFLPNRLFRLTGGRWIKVEDDVRRNPTPGAPGTNKSLKSGFINNTATTTQDDNTVISQRQALSKALEIQEDDE